MRVILALAVLILGSTGGEIAITHGMKATGEPTRLRPMALLQFLGRAVSNGWFWAGVPLMALSFYSLLVLLSWEPISFVIPGKQNRSEEHTSELQSLAYLVCRLLLEKKKKYNKIVINSSLK